jgi:hypothetical protein
MKRKKPKKIKKIISKWCNYCMQSYDYYKGCSCERESERR